MTAESALQNALETVENLPLDDQAQLVEIIYRRLQEQRRDDLLQRVAEAREAYRTQQVLRGTVGDFMAELSA